MTVKILRPLILFAAVAALAGAAAPAFADLASSKAAVDAGKASGTVGEQGDGYLGIVSGGDPALRAAVAEINAGRTKVYAEAGAKAGTSAEAAGQAAAKTLIDRLPAGQYYKPLGGAWTRK